MVGGLNYISGLHLVSCHSLRFIGRKSSGVSFGGRDKVNGLGC